MGTAILGASRYRRSASLGLFWSAAASCCCAAWLAFSTCATAWTESAERSIACMTHDPR